jgi:SAM-dependent methyltransferase
MIDSTKSVEWLPCILCGSIQSENISSQEYKGIEYGIERCRKCGLIYINPRYVLENKGDFYRDPKITDKGSTVGLRATPAIVQRFGFREKYMGFYDKFTGSKRVLDYVCRDGSFLEVLKKRYGWNNLYGLDNRLLLVKMAAEKGFKVSNQTIEQAKFDDKFFDIIVMRHTLEHLYEPHIALQEVHRVLKDDGYLRIEVPNINSLSHKVSGNKWGGFYVPWHLYYFSKETLSRLLRQEGFEVVSLDTLPYPHYFLSPLNYVRFVVRGKQVEKIVGKTLSDSVMIGIMLYLPNLISVSMGMGDELVAICRRK